MLSKEQIQQILDLRKRGYGYKSISGILQINKDVVRNLCKKHGLIGYMPIVEGDIEKPKIECQNCGCEINTENHKGRIPKFCSEECRRNWWKENEDKKNKMAWYTFTCNNCGKEFKVYGNKKRKYCSVKCASDYRFGSTTQEEMVLF